MAILSEIFTSCLIGSMTKTIDYSSLQSTRFWVPFLNGGLFRVGEDERGITVQLSKKEWAEIFDFLNEYHWIIEEDVGELEDEKILTPEILGHVYERSVVEWEQKGFEEEVAEALGEKTERKAKGVFYTPEIITDYICRETIVSRLLDQLGNGFSSISEFLSKATVEDLGAALEILDRLSILDPACGSGAFLIRAADSLFQLKSQIRSKLHQANDPYALKLEIATTNIFGVDILEGAAEIAKLRLWLWLVSSFSSKEGLITPLPNIEYNIVVGDSLVGWLREKFLASLDIQMSDKALSTLEKIIANLPDNNLLKQARDFLSRYDLSDFVKASSILDDAYKMSTPKMFVVAISSFSA